MIAFIGAFCTTHEESRPLQHSVASRHEPPFTPITNRVEYTTSKPIKPLNKHIIIVVFACVEKISDSQNYCCRANEKQHVNVFCFFGKITAIRKRKCDEIVALTFRYRSWLVKHFSVFVFLFLCFSFLSLVLRFLFANTTPKTPRGFICFYSFNPKSTISHRNRKKDCEEDS